MFLSPGRATSAPRLCAGPAVRVRFRRPFAARPVPGAWSETFRWASHGTNAVQFQFRSGNAIRFTSFILSRYSVVWYSYQGCRTIGAEMFTESGKAGSFCHAGLRNNIAMCYFEVICGYQNLVRADFCCWYVDRTCGTFLSALLIVSWFFQQLSQWIVGCGYWDRVWFTVLCLVRQLRWGQFSPKPQWKICENNENH